MQTVLFDFDGTLFDTISFVVSVTNEVLTDRGYAPVGADEVRRGMLHATGLRMGLHCGVRDRRTQDELAVQYYLRAQRYPQDSVVPFPAVPRLLEALAAHKTATGIVSNNSEVFIEGILRRYAMRNLFSVVLGEGDVPAAKPAPDGLLKAVTLLGSDPTECVYVGDAPADCDAARAARMRSIGVSWGTFDATELLAAGFEIVVENAQELLELLIETTKSAPRIENW